MRGTCLKAGIPAAEGGVGINMHLLTSTWLRTFSVCVRALARGKISSSYRCQRPSPNCCRAAVAGESAAAASCANPVACENQLPGTPQSVWDVSKGEGTTIQGFADPFSVNIGQVDQLQDQVAGHQLHDRHLPDGLLRRGRRAPGRERHAEHLGVAEPACLQHQHRRPAWSTAATGACRRPGTCPTTAGVRGLLRAHLPHRRHHRREPDPVRGDQQRQHFGHRVHDLRRDLAGLQRLGRLQPVHRERHRQPWCCSALDPGRAVAGQLQPAVRDPLSTPRAGRTSSSTPNSR